MRKLEVIVLNAQDSIEAKLAGADRLELVSNMEFGGLSPSIETIRQVIEMVDIPVNVMVRFQRDGFVYNESEMDKILDYIKKIRDMGINGIVFGSLNDDGEINMKQLHRVVSAAKGLDVTFHRAIDESKQMFLNNFKQIDGVVRTVLTSGGLETPIEDNVELLKSISNAKTRVLVGGGITEENAKYLTSELANCDFHIGTLAYNNKDFNFGINPQAIKKFKLILENKQ